jgi:hypothetical protein
MLFEKLFRKKIVRKLIGGKESLKYKITFIGLKSFIYKCLASKGYSYSPTYAQINVLKDKIKYDVENDSKVHRDVKRKNSKIN